MQDSVGLHLMDLVHWQRDQEGRRRFTVPYPDPGHCDMASLSFDVRTIKDLGAVFRSSCNTQQPAVRTS